MQVVLAAVVHWLLLVVSLDELGHNKRGCAEADWALGMRPAIGVIVSTSQE